LIVNPGSVGLPAIDEDSPKAFSSYHCIENASPDARYTLIEKTKETWCYELISVPYDHESMARLADRRGWPDGASALYRANATLRA
jgi:hypothetical protein